MALRTRMNALTLDRAVYLKKKIHFFIRFGPKVAPLFWAIWHSFLFLSALHSFFRRGFAINCVS